MSDSSTLFPIPKPLQSKSTVFDLKERLDWGEPALTIIDIRDREAFNNSRITGAISMPADKLVAQVSTSLECDRDIYIYGNTDEQTHDFTTKLREAGYQSVAEIIGGLAAWRAAKGPIEGSFAVSI
ncbi:MAG: rhodanese-like domain-containing protein [Cyanobacteria bacterium P01_G01_bin.38]